MKNGSWNTSGSASTTAPRRPGSGPSPRGRVLAKTGRRTSDLLDLLAPHAVRSGRTARISKDEQEGDAFFQVRVDDAEELLEHADRRARR